MSVLGIVAHIGLLIHMGKDAQSIIQNLVQKKETFPSQAEFLELLDDALELVTSGLLGLPDDVTKTIATALTGVKAQLSPAFNPRTA